MAHRPAGLRPGQFGEKLTLEGLTEETARLGDVLRVGGALSVVFYAIVELAAHRWQSRWVSFLDYLVMLPRALPGLIVGLAFLWVFLFFKPIAPLRTTLFSLWIAYTVVWLAYGLRLISASLLQVKPELEEAARVTGALPVLRLNAY